MRQDQATLIAPGNSDIVAQKIAAPLLPGGSRDLPRNLTLTASGEIAGRPSIRPGGSRLLPHASLEQARSDGAGLLQLLGGIDRQGVAGHRKGADADACLDQAQLLQLFGVLQGRMGQ